MTVADDIAYLRGLTSHTMMTASPFRFHQIADRLEQMKTAIQDVLDDDAEHATGYEPISEVVLDRCRRAVGEVD